ncbi:lipopolysaccharide biosynthesis protein [Methylococcus sp. EFPC2]|uniref:lipopolysaccharide biosynthesis protein n=1 Tax=Methylococcus sp. EFPC2 TaxID=2812648 RepID=UPI001967F346|nr:polysaccharide biosynthesis C-terminal domain-containing protein [Methylococcus sp. EFPC2]QSA98935.1 oligosaccharide flippase family protein [Methylococcus sp. EFPC2]
MSKVIKWIKSGGAISLMDQAVSSLGNFLTAMMLAKSLTPSDFGVYTLINTTMLVTNGLAAALVIMPLRVLGVGLAGKRLDLYVSHRIIFQFIITSLLAAAGIAFLYVEYTHDNSLLLTYIVYSILGQLQEFGRACNASHFKWMTLFVSDILSVTTRVALLAAMVWGGALDVVSAILICSLGYAVGSLIGSTGKARFILEFKNVRKSWFENWRFGKWLMFESAVYTVSTQVYFYLIASWVDIESAGAFGAAQVLLNMLNVVMLGLVNYAVPVARKRLLENGQAAWKQWWRLIGSVIFIINFTACILISIFAVRLLSMLFQPTFSQYAYIVPILACAMVLTSLTTVMSAALRTAELPQAGFAAKLISAVLTLVIAHPLIMSLNVAGAAIGMIVTQLCWLLVYVYSLKERVGPRQLYSSTS